MTEDEEIPINDDVREYLIGVFSIKDFLEEFSSESDRATAVLGGAYLDNELGHLLSRYFVDDKKVVSKLLDGGFAPLGSFSTRIDLAYSLGLTTQQQHKDMVTVKDIRNRFAHELHGLSFDNMSIRDKCKNLTIWHSDEILQWDESPEIREIFDSVPPRRRYIMAVATLILQVKAQAKAVKRKQSPSWPMGPY